jgi:DNA invertase Pin-like site-specific DNA recombinase
MDTPATTYDAIIRVSRVGERERIKSPKQQRADIAAWAAERGYVIGEWIEELDVSGKTTDRVGLGLARRRALAGETAGFVVYDIKRFSRNTVEGLVFADEMTKAGRHFFSLCYHNGDGDFSTNEGRYDLIKKLGAAEYQRGELKGHFDRGVKETIEAGVHLQAPFGYSKPGPAEPLVINDAEAPTVRRIFELRADGWSWQAIASELNEHWAAPRRRHGRQPLWQFPTVAYMAKNEVYLGTAWNGAHRYPDAHAAIVDAELFHKTNRTKGTRPIGNPDGNLLTGLLRCATCGYVMGRRGKLYACTGHHARGECPARAYISVKRIEQHVAERFIRDWLVDLPEAGGNADTSDDVDTALAAQQRALTVYERVLGMVGDYASEIERVSFERRLAEARTALAAAEREVAAARMRARSADLPEDLDEATWATFGVADRRHLLSTVYAAIVVNHDPSGGRAPIGERVPASHFLRRDDAPTDNRDLIGFVAGLQQVPARPGVAAA